MVTDDTHNLTPEAPETPGAPASAASPATLPAPEPPAAELIMPRLNFGQRLLQLRIDKNASLTDVAEKTRMTVDIIQRLETGDFAQLDIRPHYCKCLIERLCLYYDVPADDILEAYEQDRANYALAHGQLSGDASDNRPLFDDSEETPSHQHRLSAILIGTVTVLLVLLIIGGWAYKRYEQQRQAAAAANYDLPSLVSPPKLPMDALPIPNS